jgi:hypothetical protein
MSKRIGVWVVIAALTGLPALSFAAGEHGGTAMSSPSSWTQEVGWANQAKGKLIFGLKNTLLGWTELVTEPKEALNEGGNFFVGVGQGLWNGVGQTVLGAAHAVTFPITQIDIPLPEGGTQLM